MARQGNDDLASWRPVTKRRRITRFSLAGRSRVGVPGLGGESRCAVELTEVQTGGEAWWTLGFEATGPPNALRSELDAAASLVFAQALPDGVDLAMDNCRSYAQWLLQRRQG